MEILRDGKSTTYRLTLESNNQIALNEQQRAQLDMEAALAELKRQVTTLRGTNNDTVAVVVRCLNCGYELDDNIDSENPLIHRYNCNDYCPF